MTACTYRLASYRYQAPGRIIAIGDIHGNYAGMVDILQRTQLIDANQRWIGQDATLVQVGDFLDRGEHVRKVMDLLINLQAQAAQGGGRVLVLLGNHEAMHLVGSYRDVSIEVYRHFADAQSINRQRTAYQQWQHAQERGSGTVLSEEKWKGSPPPWNAGIPASNGTTRDIRTLAENPTGRRPGARQHLRARRHQPP